MRWLQTTTLDHGEPNLGVLDPSQPFETAADVDTVDAWILRDAHEGIVTTRDLLAAVAEHGLDASAWVAAAENAGRFERVQWTDLLSGQHPRHRLHYPVTPVEVWGCGVTYRPSADFREDGSGIYARVYTAPRPELFFKATADRCVGPGDTIGMRSDSTFTAAEPEVALVLGRGGRVLGFTLANDVSAWDIEHENPLYLPQSKTYRRCFAFGPLLVTPDEIADPYALDLSCHVARGTREVFRGSTSTAALQRRFEDMIGCLGRCNDIHTGTVLATGTGIIQPLGSGLAPGDVVTITSPQLGSLTNIVALV